MTTVGRAALPAWAFRKDLDPRELRQWSVMGIVNVTPDSFSDGGAWFDTRAAIAHGLQLASEGADILDVGGESTRPGAAQVSLEEELRRVLPVVRGLAEQTPCRISVDTRKAAVVAECAVAGASIVNDISALRDDPRMMATVAGLDLPVILMHMQGTPETMQTDPRYDDVVVEVARFFQERLQACQEAGIHNVAADPGIGFGKRLEDNLALLGALRGLSPSGIPVLIGTSRKSFLGRITGADVGDRLPETIASTVAAWYAGAGIFRVHDVAAARKALAVASAIQLDAGGRA